MEFNTLNDSTMAYMMHNPNILNENMDRGLNLGLVLRLKVCLDCKGIKIDDCLGDFRWC